MAYGGVSTLCHLDAYYMEDMILVTDTGREILTRGLPATAAEIEEVMQASRGIHEGRADPEARRLDRVVSESFRVESLHDVEFSFHSLDGMLTPRGAVWKCVVVQSSTGVLEAPLLTLHYISIIFIL